MDDTAAPHTLTRQVGTTQSPTMSATAVNMAGAGVASAGIFLLVFGIHEVVPVHGVLGWAVDFAPSAFFVAFMTTLGSRMLSKRRIGRGDWSPYLGESRLPRRLVPRALLVAGIALIVPGAIVATVVSLTGPDSLPWWPAFIVKVLYGAAVAGFVTVPTLNAARR